MNRLTMAGGFLLLAGCAADGSVDREAAPAGASAVLRDAGGQERAQANVIQQTDGVRVAISGSGMSPGTYGVHVHTVGRCEAPNFASAGSHWNPAGRQHGSENPQGPHMGDLPNLVVGSDGSGNVAFTIAGASLRAGASPLLDADGASVVVHASPDDYRTDPSGNSGARIACGVLG